MSLIIGVSASLRNARFGKGSVDLINDIKKQNTQAELFDFLKSETKIRADDFFKAGRENKLPFDEIYEQLSKLKGDRGLSNSEAALVAGLWGAQQEGADIEHLGLSSYFLSSGRSTNLDELKSKLLKASGILLATPVYFGDRSSLSQSFIEYISADPDLKKHLKNKVYAGIAVGAKRNGGQETTLIYQLLDMVNLNLLAVGNDSDTTAQYGGTAVAGDVGGLADDRYGLDTCIGVGKRLGRVCKMLSHPGSYRLKDPLILDVWLLQDTLDHQGLLHFKKWADCMLEKHSDIVIRIQDFTERTIGRCIACDLCPTEAGDVHEYRCIVTTKRDLFSAEHENLLQADAILLAAFSPADRNKINSVYQRFIERTRYLRRDNYVLGDQLVAPFVLSELSARQNLHLRMLTSLIRHHTIMHHPLLGMQYQGQILNWDELIKQSDSFVDNAKRILIGKYLEGGRENIEYNPIGYVISSELAREEKVKLKTQAILKSVKQGVQDKAKTRLFENEK